MYSYWTPAYGRAKAGRPARTYIQHRCEGTGCSPEDLPEAMNDREKWRERVRDIRASGTTWWWWLLPLWFNNNSMSHKSFVCAQFNGQTVLFDPEIRPYQLLPLRAGVDLGMMPALPDGFSAGIWVITNLLKFPRLFSVFWPILIKL